MKDSQPLELCQLYYDRGDFNIAKKKLALIIQSAKAEGLSTHESAQTYVEAQLLLMRIFAEQDNTQGVERTKKELLENRELTSIQSISKYHFTLALCASHQKKEEEALGHLEKALSVALTKDDKEAICYAVNGLAIVYTSMGRLEDALKEIYNLQVFFQVLPLPEVELSSKILNGHILRLMGKTEQALEILWRSYDQLKDQKKLYLQIQLLYAIGMCYLDAGDRELAKVYLNLALRSINPGDLKRYARVVREKLSLVGSEALSDYDLVFDLANNEILEKQKGRIDFRNQFILLDMLKLFVQTPGEIYSKEALVKRIWRQDYDPSVHDNKIYVTIKRLRKLIEPDYDRPKYIYRAKNGYYLSKEARVLVH